MVVNWEACMKDYVSLARFSILKVFKRNLFEVSFLSKASQVTFKLPRLFSQYRTPLKINRDVWLERQCSHFSSVSEWNHSTIRSLPQSKTKVINLSRINECRDCLEQPTIFISNGGPRKGRCQNGITNNSQRFSASNWLRKRIRRDALWRRLNRPKRLVSCCKTILCCRIIKLRYHTPVELSGTSL